MSNHDDQILTTLKILIIGESGVGKSSLLLRFTDDRFDVEMAATIGVDFKGTILFQENQNEIPTRCLFLLVKQLEVDGNRVKLAIWVNINVRFLFHNSHLANRADESLYIESFDGRSIRI